MNTMRLSHKNLIWIAILIYALVFGTVAALRHHQFKTQTWDMGIFDQTMWNTSQGRIMQNSIEETPNHLGVHMSPFLFILLPGYALFPSPYYLLIAQAIALALGALPLFFLAVRYLKGKVAFLIALVYLLYPSLHSVNLFDFHPIAFLIPTFLAGFYFLDAKRWWRAAVFLILAVSTQEDAILVVMFLGLFHIVKSTELGSLKNIFRRNWWTAERKAGAIIFFLSLIYFIVATKILMPMFGGGLLRVDRYAHLGSDFGEIIRNIFVNPKVYIETIFVKAKLAYLFWLFAPLLFLPLFSWRTVILLVPGLLENLLTNYTSQFSGTYQYDSVLIPCLFIATVLNLSLFLDRKNESRREMKKERLLVRVFLAVVIFVFLVHSPLASKNLFNDLTKFSSEENIYAYMVSAVPDNVSVAAHTRMVPHLSKRQSVAMLGYESQQADVVLVDGAQTFGFSGSDSLQLYVDDYINTGQYAVKVIDDRYFIIYREGINLNLGEYE